MCPYVYVHTHKCVCVKITLPSGRGRVPWRLRRKGLVSSGIGSTDKRFPVWVGPFLCRVDVPSRWDPPETPLMNDESPEVRSVSRRESSLYPSCQGGGTDYDH